MMDIQFTNYLTFRNIVLVIFCLPLITILFLSLLSKNTKEWLELLGFFGFIASAVIVVELGLRTIASVIVYVTQKSKYFSEITNENVRLVKRYEPFESFYITYFIVFLIISVAT